MKQAIQFTGFYILFRENHKKRAFYVTVLKHALIMYTRHGSGLVLSCLIPDRQGLQDVFFTPNTFFP